MPPHPSIPRSSRPPICALLHGDHSPLHVLMLLVGVQSGVTSLHALSGSKHRFAAGDTSGTVRLWDIRTPTEPAHTCQVQRSASTSHMPRMVASIDTFGDFTMMTALYVPPHPPSRPDPPLGLTRQPPANALTNPALPFIGCS